MIDLIKEFPRLEKVLSKYAQERVQNYDKSKCKKLLRDRIERMNDSWDMKIGRSRGGTSGNGRNGGQQFLGQISYPLVKQQIITRRAIFSSNFRADPLFSLRAIGNTPQENALNMQDLIQSNNEQIHFRQETLQPSIDAVCRWGVSVINTEYANNQVTGWRTVADPLYGARRVHGIVKNTHNAVCERIDPLNYGQNPDVVSCDDSDYKFSRVRMSLSKLVDRINAHPELYIEENVAKIIKRVKQENALDKNFYDPQGKQSPSDFNKVAINDVVRMLCQFQIEGNEDDSTFYYVEMIDETIIRFQDNPYDMNMNTYTVLTCEPRYEYWWGNTPAEYSIGNENLMNLMMGISVENALDSLKKYIFFNKNAIDPMLWMNAASNAKIPVDVKPDVNMNTLLWTYQVPESSANLIDGVYKRILDNDSRVSTRPDPSKNPGGENADTKTATEANIMANRGDTLDADILERYSYCLSKVGEKEATILAQFLGNFGPILIKPGTADAVRMVQKAQITGNYQFVMETALQQSYQGELMRYQNIVSWLQNLVNGGAAIKPNLVPIVRQVLKMGKFLKIDEVMPEEDGVQGSPQYQQTATMPGQEMAGAGQEMMAA